MSVQEVNQELIDLLTPFFWRKGDTLPTPEIAPHPLPALYQMMPYVRCIWPMGIHRYVVVAPDYWTYVRDIACEFDLVMNGAVPPTGAFGQIPGADAIPPYVYFDGNSAYLSRATDDQFRSGIGGPGYADIGYLMGAWWRFVDFPGEGTEEALISKWSVTDADKQYMLSIKDTRNIVFRVAHNFGGVHAVETVTSTNPIPDDTKWHFIIGCWSSSSNRLYTFIDGEWTSKVITQYPFYGGNSGVAPFQISGYNGANWLFGRGYVSMAILCCGAVSENRVQWLYNESRGYYDDL